MFEAQVSFDLLMMVITGGKERDEHEWRKIFMDAGFGHYKTRLLLGFLSIIELYV
uniref:O-methyltransferase C-terminal domain-containing protein n=1 Tax=Arundo donax TaxID=35708 RepID=A0A0A9C743_ARUDO